MSKQRKPRIFPKRCFLCKSPDHFARNFPFRQTFNNEEVKKKKKKSKEEIVAGLDKRTSKSTNMSSNEKSIQIHNSLETNESAWCLKF